MNKVLVTSFLLFLSTAHLAEAKSPIEIRIQLSQKDKSYLADKYHTIGVGVGKPSAQKKVKINPEAYEFVNPSIEINEEKLSEVELNTRGNQCLAAPRRCFSIKSETSVKLPGTTKLKGKSFNLISLWQDEGYITSEFGYSMYRDLGLFHLKSEYAEVFIDGKTNGLYLMTEKADKVLRKKFDSAFVGRTQYLSLLEIKEYEKDKTTFSVDEYADEFKSIMNSNASLPNDELYKKLSEKMNIDNYLRLMAANSIAMNGDYIDEVYFYSKDKENTDKVYFDVMAWDLDDLFKTPHWGPWNDFLNKKKLSQSLLYSLESKLDRAISGNPDLYARYAKILKSMLKNEFTNEFIDNHAESVKSKILPYLKENILAQSLRDDRSAPAYTKSYILKLLEERKAQLKARRAYLLTKV